MNVFDNSGQLLGALPSNAIRIDSSSGNVHTLLTGKYVDPDGIVYDPDGTVNESATALYARQVATLRVQQATSMFPGLIIDPVQVRQDSINEQSAADAERALFDAQASNVYQTAAEIPDLVSNAVSSAWNITQWLIVGFVAFSILQTYNRIPTRKEIRRHIVKHGKRKVKEYRRQLGNYVAGG